MDVYGGVVLFFLSGGPFFGLKSCFVSLRNGRDRIGNSIGGKLAAKVACLKKRDWTYRWRTFQKYNRHQRDGFLKPSTKWPKSFVLIWWSVQQRILISHGRLGIPHIRVGFPVHDRIGGQRLLHPVLRRDTSSFSIRSPMPWSNTNKTFTGRPTNTFNTKTKRYEHDNRKSQTSLFWSGSKSFSCENPSARSPKMQLSNVTTATENYDCVNESRPGHLLCFESDASCFLSFSFERSDRKHLCYRYLQGRATHLRISRNIGNNQVDQRSNILKKLFCFRLTGSTWNHIFDEISELGVSHFTLTINAVDIEIPLKRYIPGYAANRKFYRGKEAAKVLLDKQLECIPLLKAKGITVKITRSSCLHQRRSYSRSSQSGGSPWELM